MDFLNLKKKKKKKQILHKDGFVVIKNFLKIKTISKIQKDVKKKINNLSYLKIPSNIKAISEKKKTYKPASWLPKKYHTKFKGDQFKQPTGEINIKVKPHILKKGYKYYSKFTNSIEFKNPLINFTEINKIIFNKDLFAIAKTYLKSTPYLGYVALRCHFKNNLPNNDFNLYHTDGRTKITKKDFKLLKFLVPFHLEKKQLIEFNQVVYRRNKIKSEDFYKYQYSNKNELPRYLKNKIVKPNVKKGDAFFFDPDNFFHNATKPKKLRIMLYIIFIKKKNYMIPKTKKIFISRDIFNNLESSLKESARFLRKVNAQKACFQD